MLYWDGTPPPPQIQKAVNYLNGLKYINCLEIPSECVMPKDSNIITSIFSDFNEEDVTKRVILTPTNA